MDRFLPQGCLNEAAPYTIHVENGVEKYTTVVPNRAPLKSRKEKTSERLDSELQCAIGSQAGQSRLSGRVGVLEPPGRRGTSLNPNKNYMWDFVDDSWVNRHAHEVAVAICEGWRWKPWKGFIWRGKIWTGKTTEGAHWEELSAQIETSSLPVREFPLVSARLTQTFNAAAPMVFKDERNIIKGRRVDGKAIAELNETCERYLKSPVEEKDNFYVTVCAFARLSKFVWQAHNLIKSSPMTHLQVDDIINNFALNLIDRVEKGQYAHRGKFQNWMAYIWNRFFFPETQTEFYSYLAQTTFVNPLDEGDAGFEFKDHRVAQSGIDNQQEDREDEGYSVPMSADKILRELDDPNTPLGKLRPPVKIMLRGIAGGLSQKQIAVNMKCSEKTIRRGMADARRAGVEMQSGGVLPTLQSCDDESNLLPWPEENSFSIQACADEFSDRFLTPDEAASYLGGLNSRTLTRWAREGYIPAIPMGEGKRRLWRFLRTDLESWMLSRRQGGQNAA